MLAAALGLTALAAAQSPMSLTPAEDPVEALPKSVVDPANTNLTAGVPLTGRDVEAWLDGYLPYALRSGDIAGAVVVVVKDGQVLAQRGYGYADIAKRTPVDPETTLFRPGSVSKLITWSAVMQQVEQGNIDLDADINRYLDGPAKVPPYDGKPITMRQILTHTAGFEEMAKNLIVTDPKDATSAEAYLKYRMPSRIFAPGTTPAYSNYATTLAGYIVQRTSGMPFDDYIERNIFAPLKMTRSTFRQPLPPSLAPLMATGYQLGSGEPVDFEIVVPAAAGAMSSPGSDMAKFMIAHLQSGRGILRPETAQLMHGYTAPGIGPLNRMKLGFFETNRNGREIIAHLGDLQVFHTALHLWPQEGVGLYLSVNASGKEGVAGTLRTALLDDFSDRYFPRTGAADGKVEPKTSRQHAEMMQGRWLNSRHMETGWPRLLMLLSQSKVGVGEDGELVIPDLKTAGGAVRKWVEIAPFVWREVGGHDRLAAVVQDGKVVRWSMDGISPFMVFDRIPGHLNADWLIPALSSALVVLLLTLLHWPLSAVARWRYGQRREFTGSRMVYRGTRLGAGLVIAAAVAWLAALSVMFEAVDSLSAKSDPLLWFLQIFGLLALLVATAFAALNVRSAWREGWRWYARAWAVIALAATLLLFWAAWIFGLISMTVKYGWPS